MKTKKVKKRRLNLTRLLILILFIYILVCAFLYVYNEPVRHYEIVGNNFISDADILREAKLVKYPSFVSVNTKRVQKKLEKNPLIQKAQVKYFWDFTIKIEITENKPVFSIKSSDKVCLSDGTLIDYDTNFIGIPTLLNDTTEETMKILASSLSEVDEGVLYTISEIEYRPSYNSSNVVIDKNRFLLSMNDNNMVYITAKNAKVMNRYLDIIAAKQLTEKGTFFLDGTEGNYSYKAHREKEASGGE